MATPDFCNDSVMDMGFFKLWKTNHYGKTGASIYELVGSNRLSSPALMDFRNKTKKKKIFAMQNTQENVE